MKKIFHKASLWLAVFIAFASLVPTNVFAVTGTVQFGPDGNTVTSGSEFYVEVIGNVPDPGGWWGGGATIRFNYDATKLQYVSADDTGGAFRQNNSQTWSNGTPGVVNYVAQIFFNAPGVNNQKIIGVKFKAIGTGSTTLTFAPSTNVNDGPTTGTAKTFTILPVSCPAGQVGTPPNCSTPAPSPNPTPVPTRTPTPTRTPVPSVAPVQTPTPSPVPTPTTEVTPTPVADSDGGLKIENVKAVITRQKSNVTWSMNRPDVEPELNYGLTKANMKSKAVVTKLSDGSFEATFTEVKPGTLYHFAIKAATLDQLKSANYSGTFTTKGFPVQITVKQNGTLAPDSKVIINGRSFVANKNATIAAEFGDGSYEASVTPKNSESSYKATFVVKKITLPTTGEPQTQLLVLDGTIEGAAKESNENSILLMLGIGGAVAAGLAFIGFIFYRKKVNDSQNEASIDSDLLVSNYGNAIDDSRSLTPEPNLDMQPSAAVPSSYSQQIPLPDQNNVYNYDPLPDQANEPPLDTAAVQQVEANPYIEPVTPPAYEQQDIQNYNMENPVQPAQDTPLQSTTDEQLSEQLIAVESIDANSDMMTTSEEAIYHPETGELDIIHSNNKQLPKHELPTSIESITNESTDNVDLIASDTITSPVSATQSPTTLQVRTTP